MSGELRDGSMAHRVAEYFAANPDEELTFEDARVKFDFSELQLRHVLCRLRTVGCVETLHLIRAKRG